MAIFGHRQRLFYSIYLFLLQYTFNLKTKLEWGYGHLGMVSLCFRGAVFLVLSLRQSLNLAPPLLSLYWDSVLSR